MKKQTCIIAIGLIMMIGIFDNVSATSYMPKESVPKSSYIDENLNIEPIKTSDLPLQRSVLGSSYVSPYITSVKSQSPYGTCWAFSCMAASEASMIKEGLALKDSVDLSEWHLAFFLSHSVADPLGGTIGDSLCVNNTSYLEIGGNQEFATFRMANWYGLVDEETVPYSTVVASSTAQLSDEYAYSKDVAHLENAYWISMENADIVKQMIKSYGACAASYYTEDQYYSTGHEGSWNQDKEVAVYCPETIDTNHGITIVGWDDNYSKDNFGDTKPTSDGAWYCKNSWGSSWSKNGYFWISYEDVPLNSGDVFFYDYGSVDNYNNNYQYDGGAWAGYTYTCDYAANVFTADKDEYLKAVGFYTRQSDYDCKVEIYKNPSEGNPISGTCVASKEADQLYAGFHTVSLNEAIELEEGDMFSVVVYQSDSDGNAVPIIIDADYSDDYFTNTSSAQVGQSYVARNGYTPTDISAEGANCRIKAYTDTKIHVTDIELDCTQLTLNVDESNSLVESLTPENASDKRVNWSSDDSSIATVDAEGIVTAVAAGKTKITCTTVDGTELSAQCEVTVLQPVEQIVLNYKSYDLVTDGMVQLDATVLPEDASDKTIQWSSADEAVAVVSETGLVTAKGYGTTSISCTALDYNTCVATCTVTVTEKMIAISLNQTSLNLEEGQRLQLSATTNPNVERTKGIYWLSSNASIASVDSNGWVTAVASGGPVEIQCVAKDGSGVLATCLVTVNTKKEESTTNNNTGTIDDLQIESDTDDASILLKKQYNIGTNGTVQLVNGDEISAVVTIPSSVEIDGVTYKVTSIAANAFKNNKQITSVKIGGNVQSIGKNAFNGCSNLTSVTVGKSVKSIGANAFYNCKSLTNVTLGNNIATIGDKAFYQCNKLKKLVIPSKVNKIGKQAFYKCKNLKSITIKTSKLTNKKVGKNAFKGIHSKAVIKVPKKKLTTYKKLLKAKGIGSKVRVKK